MRHIENYDKTLRWSVLLRLLTSYSPKSFRKTLRLGCLTSSEYATVSMLRFVEAVIL